jgi:beta-N-acetylhexosaminidase
MRILSFTLSAILLLFLNCSGTHPEIEEKKGEVRSDPTEIIKPSIEEMIGQMLMVGVDANTLKQNPSVIKYLKANTLGGIILYEKNISKVNSKELLKSFCTDIQKQSSNYVFIGIDQEGGLVNRLKTKYGFPASVTATFLGDKNNADTTTFYASRMANTISDLGINVNFAPCVDLCSNPNNPIIAKPKRCFSDNPELVAEHAGIFNTELMNKGVLPVLKHFPGHGSSRGDTHLDMADVTQTWNENELIPYQKLIEQNNVPAIMSAHIINANLDSDTIPSTLSKSILTDLLRTKMGFNGVIFSDDMQMKAISKYYGLENAIEMAVIAGVDVLMFSGNIPGTDTPTIERVHTTFRKLLKDGKITEDRIYESYVRIIDLKKTLK